MCVCVLVSFFKGVTWQLDSNYKMAGVSFSMAKARSQHRRGAGQKQLHFERHACQLFSASGCKHIYLTMHQDGPLHCPPLNSHLTIANRKTSLQLTYEHGQTRVHAHTHGKKRKKKEMSYTRCHHLGFGSDLIYERSTCVHAVAFNTVICSRPQI